MNDKMSWKHTVAYLTSYKTYLRGRGMLGSIHKKCGNQYWYWAYKSKFNSFYYGTIIANTESLWYWARSRGTGSICRAAVSVVSVSVCSRVIILLYLLLQFSFSLWAGDLEKPGAGALSFAKHVSKFASNWWNTAEVQSIKLQNKHAPNITVSISSINIKP